MAVIHDVMPAFLLLQPGSLADARKLLEQQGPDGWILTKASLLTGKIVCRLKDGRELEARLIGVHDPHDLALVKIEVKGLVPVQWADSKAAPVGNWVASPGIGEEPVAVGVVSVAARTAPYD